MVKKILLVEDDKKISELVKQSLVNEGYFVDQSFDGESGYYKIIEDQPDLVILDIMMPKMNGYKVCAKVREIGVTTPIIMLTAKSGEYDVEEGLDTGANDYLKKPFSTVELLARIRRLLKTDGHEKALLEFQDLKIDLNARKVTSKDLEIELTKQELDLLAFLVMNNGNIVTKNELLEEIWEILYPVEEDINKVEVYIGYLRKKLKPFNLNGRIKTVRGYGYRWN
ncbi:response regulator transcription factor [Acidimicrobiia bacterium]|nr:response regulator transcription factor [Candidatus Actinomarina sp.]MDC0871276.1 response regulator transcription factor [Acidimicrobiia bacterium]